MATALLEPRAANQGPRNLSFLSGLDLTRFRAELTMPRGQTGVHKLIHLVHYSLLPPIPFRCSVCYGMVDAKMIDQHVTNSSIRRRSSPHLSRKYQPFTDHSTIPRVRYGGKVSGQCSHVDPKSGYLSVVLTGAPTVRQL